MWRPSRVSWPPISVRGILAPAEADAATLFPTIESSPNPSRRFTSRPTEFSVWSCVELEPPSEVVLAPERCCVRSKLSWMPSARVSVPAWLRCMGSRPGPGGGFAPPRVFREGRGLALGEGEGCGQPAQGGLVAEYPCIWAGALNGGAMGIARRGHERGGSGRAELVLGGGDHVLADVGL